MNPRSSSEIAEELASRIGRLEVSRRDPERFHVEKDAIARELRDLSHRLRGRSEPAPTVTLADLTFRGRGHRRFETK